ncbi:OB-fold nucleic acid binding domain-containing protein [Streptomyces sp. DSM 44917]|uniref:OB-fold nucleic acid binding domain-containing protein n=1 Tax=Streptomyces boetiae TaxID=3075541 RepID=A0ABU2L2D6_9ACTN|nr:OB-fold nucleic acid binding domain-containing protein [Streptomyces sp. DSM 44917]MDT0305667.1 OB-fold nucleic acid binding domain-containing protein [Streptomyces sp. DSM 44917]
MSVAEGGGWWTRLLGRPGRDRAGAQASGEPAGPPGPACTRIRDCGGDGPAGRPVVHVTGTLRTVTERTVAGLPALQAELDDGSATLDVVWLGRRAIAGIAPGRALVASGRIAMTAGGPVLFNPRYQLHPPEKE